MSISAKYEHFPPGWHLARGSRLQIGYITTLELKYEQNMSMSAKYEHFPPRWRLAEDLVCRLDNGM